MENLIIYQNCPKRSLRIKNFKFINHFSIQPATRSDAFVVRSSVFARSLRKRIETFSIKKRIVYFSIHFLLKKAKNTRNDNSRLHSKVILFFLLLFEQKVTKTFFQFKAIFVSYAHPPPTKPLII